MLRELNYHESAYKIVEFLGGDLMVKGTHANVAFSLSNAYDDFREMVRKWGVDN